MKTATIIFVALTVFSGLFLESSSAPNLLGGSQNSHGDLVGGLIKNVLVTVENIFDKLAKLLAGVKPEIREAFKGLLKELKTIAISLRDAIKSHDLVDILKNFNLLKAVVDKINTIINQLFEKYGDDATIKHFLDKIQKLVNDTVKDLVKLVRVVLKQSVDEIANGLPELKELVAGLIKALDEAIAKASGDQLKELLTKAKELVNVLIKQIFKLIEAFPEAIANQNLGKLPPLVAGIKLNIAEFKQLCAHTDFPDDAKNILTQFIELVDVLVPKIESISCIIDIIQNLLFTILDKTLKDVKAIIGGFLRELPNTVLSAPLKKLTDFISKLRIALKNGIIQDVQKLEFLIYKSIETIKAIIAKLLETLGDGAKEIIQKVLQALENLLKELKPIVTELVNGIKDIFSKLVKDLAGILEKIKEALTDAKGELKELLIEFKGLLKKLLEKLLDLIKAVVALLVNVTDEALNKVNGLLKEIEDILFKINGLLESNTIREDLAGVTRGVVGIVEALLVELKVLIV